MPFTRARRSGAELLLVSADGTVIVDGTQGAPPKERILDLLVAGEAPHESIR